MLPNDKLNMNRSERVVIHTSDLEWERSPAGGVWRKKLEREGAESGEVTSVVRYDPDSRFKRHLHPGGEEIYVISGTFKDDDGSYPAGTYLRNPPGSGHAPVVAEGCDIFVKLNMFKPDDTATVRIQTREQVWHPGSQPGLSVLPLHSYLTEHTALVRWQPGTHFNAHVHPGGEEIFVIDGILADEEGLYPAGTWLRNPPYSRHEPFSERGCTILVKTGHID
jgi:anti-sigma factor ChrR (cupin superfamily)